MARRKRVKKRAERESRSIEFKERFDPSQLGDWCELIKDIVSIANSGGGSITVGLKSDGRPSGWNPAPLLGLDPAQVIDKIARYTGEQFADFEIAPGQRKGQDVAEIKIGAAEFPMVFIHPGTYEPIPGKPKTAFARGTVYFRHGAKSEPGTTADLRRFVERRIAATRKSWLGNIRKVVNAPRGHQVSILPPEVVESRTPAATPIRIVDDPTAPAYRKLDPDTTHPYRQKELIQRVNERLEGKRVVTTFDIQCVRWVHNAEGRPDWYYKPKFGSPQYSEKFAAWIHEQYKSDPAFFDKARAARRGG